MISMRYKKFYKKTGRRLQFDAKEPVGFDKTKEEPKALVTLDGEGVDWTGHAEDEQENFALMAYSNSGSDTEVKSCSKECVESYAKLKKLYDEQREQLGDASIEIKAYTLALAKVEAQLVCHQKNQLAYEEKIRFMKIDLDDKTDVLTYHKKLLAEAVKEKEELKTKLENFQSSSKGLSKLLNSQMSAKDKSGLGYGDQVHEGVLSYENEVFQSVFDSRSSDVEDSPVHDRFANVEGMHAVPPPMTGNYMPPGPDREVDDSMFTYGPKQSKTSESDTQTSNFDSCESNSSVETLESVPELVVVKPEVVNQPKVWSDTPIIEEYESDSDDEYVIQPSKEQEKPMWNNVQRLESPNQLFQKHTKLENWHIPVNILDKITPSQAATTSAARKVNTARPIDNPQRALKNKGIVDSGCSRHMTGNKAYLDEYQDYNGGPVAFGGSKGYITGKDTECLVLSSDFKLPDENQVLLRIPRQNNMYSFNLENIVPSGGLGCLIAKATVDESNKWHRRLGHVNFINLNKLVKENLVRGLPSKIFQNDHTCVACQKGKQHKASCKTKVMSSISHPLQLLHMDLFRPTSVRSINHKTYCLIITNNFSRFSWVFFLRIKDETSRILKDFIRQIENQLNQNVKTIRCDNGTEFKNRD
ncbi:ribonuclease H-like domain-containing protein [Tanacetum coccineum]